MLEDAALRLLTTGEQTLTALGYFLLLAGFVAALIVRRRQRSELQRAPYFAFSALLYLIGALLPAAWLFSFQAVAAGVLWVLVAGAFGAVAVLGFCCGDIALARSRDAYGNNRSAFLAMIPLANLVLLFKGSKDPNRTKPTIPLFSGGMGVMTAFAFLVIGGISTAWVDDQLAKQANSTPEDEAGAIDFLLQARGIEATISEMASLAKLPVAIDAATTLSRIEADGIVLRRIYVVKTEASFFTDSFKTRVAQSICSYKPFGPLLQNGAIIEEVYRHDDGREIGRQQVSGRSC